MALDRAELEAEIARHRGALHAHCYRMLGSTADADDALQDALVGAWRGRETFAGRASPRAWLYRIATNACLALIAQRSRHRGMPDDARPPSAEGVAIEPLVGEPIWLEPCPAAAVERAETIELAFVAALQHLPANQRAAVLLCDVLDFTAAEASDALEAGSVAAITSALQRGRATLATRAPAVSQQVRLAALGDAGTRALVAAFVDAWARADAAALVALLARDVRFTMPPIPTWFAGRDRVGAFFSERVFAEPWQLAPIAGGANGQLAFLCYQGAHLGALNVVTLGDGGEISALTGFLDPATHARFLRADR